MEDDTSTLGGGDEDVVYESSEPRDQFLKQHLERNAHTQLNGDHGHWQRTARTTTPAAAPRLHHQHQHQHQHYSSFAAAAAAASTRKRKSTAASPAPTPSSAATGQPPITSPDPRATARASASTAPAPAEQSSSTVTTARAATFATDSAMLAPASASSASATASASAPTAPHASASSSSAVAPSDSHPPSSLIDFDDLDAQFELQSATATALAFLTAGGVASAPPAAPLPPAKGAHATHTPSRAPGSAVKFEMIDGFKYLRAQQPKPRTTPLSAMFTGSISSIARAPATPSAATAPLANGQLSASKPTGKRIEGAAVEWDEDPTAFSRSGKRTLPPANSTSSRRRSSGGHGRPQEVLLRPASVHSSTGKLSALLSTIPSKPLPRTTPAREMPLHRRSDAEANAIAHADVTTEEVDADGNRIAVRRRAAVTATAIPSASVTPIPPVGLSATGSTMATAMATTTAPLNFDQKNMISAAAPVEAPRLELHATTASAPTLTQSDPNKTPSKRRKNDWVSELDETLASLSPTNEEFEIAPNPHGSSERARKKRKKLKHTGELSARLARLIHRVKSDSNFAVHAFMSANMPLVPRHLNFDSLETKSTMSSVNSAVASQQSVLVRVLEAKPSFGLFAVVATVCSPVPHAKGLFGPSADRVHSAFLHSLGALYQVPAYSLATVILSCTQVLPAPGSYLRLHWPWAIHLTGDATTGGMPTLMVWSFSASKSGGDEHTYRQLERERAANSAADVFPLPPHVRPQFPAAPSLFDAPAAVVPVATDSARIEYRSFGALTALTQLGDAAIIGTIHATRLRGVGPNRRASRSFARHDMPALILSDGARVVEVLIPPERFGYWSAVFTFGRDRLIAIRGLRIVSQARMRSLAIHSLLPLQLIAKPTATFEIAGEPVAPTLPAVTPLATALLTASCRLNIACTVVYLTAQLDGATPCVVVFATDKSLSASATLPTVAIRFTSLVLQRLAALFLCPGTQLLLADVLLRAPNNGVVELLVDRFSDVSLLTVSRDEKTAPSLSIKTLADPLTTLTLAIKSLSVRAAERDSLFDAKFAIPQFSTLWPVFAAACDSTTVAAHSAFGDPAGLSLDLQMLQRHAVVVVSGVVSAVSVIGPEFFTCDRCRAPVTAAERDAPVDPHDAVGALLTTPYCTACAAATDVTVRWPLLVVIDVSAIQRASVRLDSSAFDRELRAIPEADLVDVMENQPVLERHLLRKSISVAVILAPQRTKSSAASGLQFVALRPLPVTPKS